MLECTILLSARLRPMRARTPREFRWCLTCNSSEESHASHVRMAYLHYHREVITAAHELYSRLGGPLSLPRILEVPERQIPQLPHRPQVLLGLFRMSPALATQGHRAVVSQVQNAQASPLARTALPHPSTAVSTPQTPSFLMDSNDWMTARSPIFIPHILDTNSF
jgi:hypothetical protein